VVSIRVPAIDSYSLLHAFVLSPSVPALLGQLLPIDFARLGVEQMASAVAELTNRQQLDSVELVYGLWQNAVACACFVFSPSGRLSVAQWRSRTTICGRLSLSRGGFLGTRCSTD
jgi:hypothetical protein